MVDKGGYLLFNNVLISDISDVNHYSYTPYQPYINRGIGYALWPSIALAPGALVSEVGGLKLIRPDTSTVSTQWHGLVAMHALLSSPVLHGITQHDGVLADMEVFKVQQARITGVRPVCFSCRSLRNLQTSVESLGEMLMGTMPMAVL